MVFFLGLFCLVGGFIIVMPLFMGKFPVLRKIDEKISSYKIIIGIAVMIFGMIRLIVPYHSAGRPLVPILGDFIPSMLSIASGVLISFDFLENIKGFQGEFFIKLKSTLTKYQFPIGFSAIGFGIIHWILKQIIFF